MKLKHFLLGISFIGCCGISFTSCERDEMGVGGSAGDLNPPSNSYSNKLVIDSISYPENKSINTIDVINY